MGVTFRWYIALVAAVALGRLVELRHSRRNRQRLAARGALIVADPAYPWMVLLHAGYLCGAPLEVYLLDRAFLPWLGLPALALFVSANALRFWVIRTLAVHWNASIVASHPLGVVTTGPYRWMRHPNYAAVFVEVAALPLIHTAWITALVAAVLHVPVLALRIRKEEGALMADPLYRREMGSKPRFLPRIVGGARR
jgi:methyltransferase